ncbi:hypothetical protein BFW01_g9191 [Lasiodiplodia theobromae]|nr:hypothetical protein BFW01_g9191 [Lasiodiplodia theobromae]
MPRRGAGRRAGVELHRSRVASPQSRTAEQQHRSYDASFRCAGAELLGSPRLKTLGRCENARHAVLCTGRNGRRIASDRDLRNGPRQLAAVAHEGRRLLTRFGMTACRGGRPMMCDSPGPPI